MPRHTPAARYGDERESFDFLVSLIREGNLDPAALTDTHRPALDRALDGLLARTAPNDAALVRKILGRVIAYRADPARLAAEHALRRAGLPEDEAFRRIAAEEALPGTPASGATPAQPTGIPAKVRRRTPVPLSPLLGRLSRIAFAAAFWTWLFGPADIAAGLAALGALILIPYFVLLRAVLSQAPHLFLLSTLIGTLLSPLLALFDLCRLLRRP